MNNEEAWVYADDTTQVYFIGIRCRKKMIAIEIINNNLNNLEMQKEIKTEIQYRHRKRGIQYGSENDLLSQMIKYIPLCKPKHIYSGEIQSEVKKTEEWRQYEEHKSQLNEIKTCEDFKKWKENYIFQGHSTEDWKRFSEEKVTVIGEMISIKKDDWNCQWKFKQKSEILKEKSC